MRYFDTSFLAPIFREEKTSAGVDRLIARFPAEELAVSRCTEVEFASLLARDVRIGAIGGGAARAADALFADVIRHSFIVLLPNAADYELARTFLLRFETALRAGDALHLAIAGNRRAEAVYTFDRTMIAAGRNLGLPVEDGGVA